MFGQREGGREGGGGRDGGREGRREGGQAALTLTILYIEASHTSRHLLTGELCVVPGGDDYDPILLDRYLVPDAR